MTVRCDSLRRAPTSPRCATHLGLGLSEAAEATEGAKEARRRPRWLATWLASGEPTDPAIADVSRALI